MGKKVQRGIHTHRYDTLPTVMCTVGMAVRKPTTIPNSKTCYRHRKSCSVVAHLHTTNSQGCEQKKYLSRVPWYDLCTRTHVPVPRYSVPPQSPHMQIIRIRSQKAYFYLQKNKINASTELLQTYEIPSRSRTQS